MEDFCLDPQLPVESHCDNKVAMHIAADPIFHGRTKRLPIDYDYIEDNVMEAFLNTSHVPSKEQVTDIMAKPLGNVLHNYLCSRLGLVDSAPIPP